MVDPVTVEELPPPNISNHKGDMFEDSEAWGGGKKIISLNLPFMFSSAST